MATSRHARPSGRPRLALARTVRPAAPTFNVSWSGVVDCFSVTNQIDGNRFCGRYAQISTASIDWSASETGLSFASAPGSSVSAFARGGSGA